MIDRGHKLPLALQAEALNISRGTIYYEPVPTSAEDLALMRRMDELHLEFPFAGSRMLRDLLAAPAGDLKQADFGKAGSDFGKQESSTERFNGIEEGQGNRCKLGRRHVTTLMRKMGIEAVYRRPNTSKPAPGHRIYPYLLRGLTIDRPNHVWATDITYIPMARGFVYLCAVMDWFARRILSWRLSNTMEAEFCVEVLQEALSRHGKPDIFNSDQGSQFTGTAFIGELRKHDIAISMDGKGAWRDNVFVERFWRSIKYEEVYLRAYDDVPEARASIGRYIELYNGRRPHSSLDRRTPDQAYFNPLPLRAAA
jgi:putative transposase